MNLLFIYPKHSPYAIAPSNFEPLALEILAATVPRHNISIFDMRYEKYSSLGRALRRGDFSVAGISVNNTMQVNNAKKIINFVRSKDSKLKIVVGGHHPALVPQDFYEPSVDAIFFGWAEKSFPEYIDRLERGSFPDDIPGIMALKDGDPCGIFDKDKSIREPVIPYPKRDLVSKYRNHYRDEIGRRTALVNTARGCPYRCTFCACWKFADGKYFARSAEDIAREIATIPRDIKRVFFADDNTFFDVKRAKLLCQMIKGEKIKKRYSGYTRADTVARNPRLSKMWKEVGLDNLTIGFEAVSNERLKQLNKSNRTEINEKAVEVLRDIGLQHRSYFLIDPDFTKQDFDDVYSYVVQHNIARPMFVTLTPLPGTIIHEQQKSKIDRSYDFFDFVHWVVPTRLGNDEFFREFCRIYYRIYSYKRWVKTVLSNLVKIVSGLKAGRQLLLHVSLWELVRLRVVAYVMKRRLRDHYLLK